MVAAVTRRGEGEGRRGKAYPDRSATGEERGGEHCPAREGSEEELGMPLEMSLFCADLASCIQIAIAIARTSIHLLCSSLLMVESTSGLEAFVRPTVSVTAFAEEGRTSGEVGLVAALGLFFAIRTLAFSGRGC